MTSHVFTRRGVEHALVGLDHRKRGGELETVARAEAALAVRELVHGASPLHRARLAQLAGLPGSVREPHLIAPALVAALGWRVWLLRRPRRAPPLHYTPRADTEVKLSDLAEGKAVLEAVSFRVVDELTGNAIAGVPLTVVLANGGEEALETDANGLVELRDLAPGHCDVRCEFEDKYFADCVAFAGFGRPVADAAPAGERTGALENLTLIGRRTAERTEGLLVRVVEHRTSAADTWESIESDYGVGKDTIAKFNFDTTDDKDVRRGLIRDIGCWRRAPQSGEILFSDRDDPGVVLVPQPFTSLGKPIGYQHVIRARRVTPPVRLFRFSI